MNPLRPAALAAFAFALASSALFVPLAGCSSTADRVALTPALPDSGAVVDEPLDAGTTDSGSADAATDGAVARGQCASVFGSALTTGFGRIDGTVVAVQIPTDQQCTMPNGTHVILQVRMNGAVYRLVVNVQSDWGGADIRTRYAEKQAPLASPPYAEGWHTGIALDYARDLDLHPAAFTAMTLDELVVKVVDVVRINAPISVYGTSGAGRPESAHLIHRQGNGDDGAIVLHPDSATPTWLAFHFVNQDF